MKKKYIVIFIIFIFVFILSIVGLHFFIDYTLNHKIIITGGGWDTCGDEVIIRIRDERSIKIKAKKIVIDVYNNDDDIWVGRFKVDDDRAYFDLPEETTSYKIVVKYISSWGMEYSTHSLNMLIDGRDSCFQ